MTSLFAESCPFGAHLCAVLQQSGRACGGKHGAQVCRIKRALLATTPAPAAAKPSATLVPARAKFGRKRASGGTEQQTALPIAALPPKRAKAAPKTPTKAVPAPNTPPKAVPKTRPKAPPKQAPLVAAAKTSGWKGGRSSGEALDQHLESVGVTCVWTSRRGGKIFLAGLLL